MLRDPRRQITTEDRFRPAFYLALRNTLVADNLDKATVASFGADRSGKAKWRVVTKAGEIIDTRCVWSSAHTSGCPVTCLAACGRAPFVHCMVRKGALLAVA